MSVSSSASLRASESGVRLHAALLGQSDVPSGYDVSSHVAWGHHLSAISDRGGSRHHGLYYLQVSRLQNGH